MINHSKHHYYHDDEPLLTITLTTLNHYKLIIHLTISQPSSPATGPAPRCVAVLRCWAPGRSGHQATRGVGHGGPTAPGAQRERQWVSSINKGFIG